jgi:serine/threonine protein kinase
MSMSQVGSGLPRLLAERYELSEQVASGGMTSVWRGHDRVLGRDVVVKVLHPELAADERFRTRFHEEAVNAARLTHPNIVALYDTGEQGDVAYVVMELVNGPTLRDALARHGPLPPSRAARLAREVAAALDYAHQTGVCHGNLKPGNILLAEDGTVKVADFSIARAASEDDVNTGEVLGIDGYLAPEVARGEVADGRADVYGLGACLYEMLTGRQPGADPSTTIPPRALRAGVSRELDTIVRQAMATDPVDRFQTVQSMASALSPSAAAADGAPAGDLVDFAPAPAGPEVQPSRSFLRHEGRLLGWTLALVAVAAVLIAIGLTVASDDIGNLFDDGSNRAAPPTQSTAPSTPIRLTRAVAYDPQGDDRQENDARAPAAIDGNAATAWGTDRYRQPFGEGGLKDGVGLVLDPGSAKRARRLTLNLSAPGASFSVYATDGEEIPADIGDWTQLVSRQDARQQVGVGLDGDPHRYYLIWFTSLPPADGGYRIEVAEAGLRS